MQLEECATESNLEALEYKRQQLLELRQKKMDGMIVIWLFEGEKKTKNFCNLEKRNFVQKAMCFLEKENGKVIHDSDAIINEARHF